MGNYTILGGLENPRRGRQARNLTTNVPKILDLKSSSEQIFSKNCRWVPLGESRKHKFFRFPPLEHQLTMLVSLLATNGVGFASTPKNMPLVQNRQQATGIENEKRKFDKLLRLYGNPRRELFDWLNIKTQ